jgi:hypothetical protein
VEYAKFCVLIINHYLSPYLYAYLNPYLYPYFYSIPQQSIQFLAHTVEYAKFCVLMRDGDVTAAADTVRALLKVRLRHYILSL